MSRAEKGVAMLLTVLLLWLALGSLSAAVFLVLARCFSVLVDEEGNPIPRNVEPAPSDIVQLERRVSVALPPAS